MLMPWHVWCLAAENGLQTRGGVSGGELNVVDVLIIAPKPQLQVTECAFWSEGGVY